MFHSDHVIQHQSSEPHDSTDDTLYLFDDMDIDDDLMDEDGIDDMFGIDLGLGGSSSNSRSRHTTATAATCRQSIPVGPFVRQRSLLLKQKF